MNNNTDIIERPSGDITKSEGSPCLFGSINPTTGESLKGYLDNGEMKFKKYPWYQRLWRKLKNTKKTDIQPKESSVITKYIGTTQFYSRWIWNNNKRYFDVAVYRTYDTSTNETIALYADTYRGRKYFNVDAYDVDGYLILI